MPFTALVADPHEVTRHGTRSLLESFGARHVATVSYGHEATDMLGAYAPDLLVTELTLPGRNGIEVLRNARDQGLFVEDRTAGLVLTSETSDPWISRAFQSGASGYVLKSEPTDEVRAAFQAVLSGDRYLSKVLPDCLMTEAGDPGELPSEIDLEETQVCDRLQTLTSREREVLTLRAMALPYKEIGERLSISRRTAEKHAENARSKLQLRNSVDVVAFAFRRGLVPDAVDEAATMQ